MNNSFYRGQISKILLILAAVILILAIIVFVVLQINASRTKDAAKKEVAQQQQEVVGPVYEAQIGNILFTLIDSENSGNVLSGQKYGGNLVTTEKFIKVGIGAQNKGKTNTSGGWDLGNVIDSEGRVFVNVNNKAGPWLPNPNSCGAILKPEFEPTPCYSYYEVSKESKGLKVEVINAGAPKKSQKELLDLKL